MFLAKLKTSAAVVLALGILGAGAGFVGYRMLPGVEAKGPANANPSVQVVVADPPGDDRPKQEIDRLRQENEELRKELRALRDKVTALERKLPREQAASQVTFQGKPVDYWLDMFKDRDPEYRQRAINALAAIGADDNRVIPALIGALKDNQVNGAAANVLGSIGKEAVPALLELLKGKDNQLRALAATALAWTGPKGKEAIPEAKEAIPLLIKCLEEEDQNLRDSAAGALGRMAPDSKSATPALIKLLAKEDLGRTYGRGGTTADALSRFGEEAVPALTEALKDPNDKTRAGAAGTLGLIGRPAKGAIPGLISALADKHALVRQNAGLALVAIGDDAVPATLEALKDKDADIRAAAAAVLGGIGSPHVVPPGRPLGGSPSPDQMSIATAKTALPALLKAMGDEDERVRNAASGAYEILKKRSGPIPPNVPIERPRAKTDS